VRTFAAGLATGVGFVCFGVSCADEESGQPGGATSTSPSATSSTTSGPLPTTTTVDDPTKQQAIAVVTNVVKAHAVACEAEIVKASAERVPGVGFWRVRVTVKVPDHTGTATWTVEEGKPVPNDEYAGDLEHDCMLAP
jgi:hypothetical protein